MDEDLIQSRRREIEQEIARYLAHVEKLREELPELDTAERVIKRLSGAKRPTTSPADKQPEAKPSGAKPEGTPTTPRMIEWVMRDAQAEGKPGLEPKEVTARIEKRWWPGVKGEYISSIMWRMWKRDDLVKGEGSLYALPGTKSAPGDSVRANTPEAETSITAQPRRTGEGGGT